MPKTFIYVGTEDPCYDDSVRFLKLLLDNGCDAFLYEYTHLPHGLLNLSTKDFYPAKLFINNMEKDIWLCFNT